MALIFWVFWGFIMIIDWELLNPLQYFLSREGSWGLRGLYGDLSMRKNDQDYMQSTLSLSAQQGTAAKIS